MKRNPLINELTDWIEKLDHPTIILNYQDTPILQHLLLRCRRELIKNPNDDQPEQESELKKQVQDEIAKQKAKLGIKE